MKAVVMETSYWMPAMTHTYKHHVSDEFWYFEGRYSALERLKAGVTTGVAVMGSQPRCDDPIFAQNHAKAYSEMGLREVVCTGPCILPWPHRFSRIVNGERVRKEVSFEDCIKSLETVIKTLHNTSNGRIRAFATPFDALASTNPSGTNPSDRLCGLTDLDRLLSKEIRRLAREYGTRIHTDAFGGTVWLAYKDENALLGPDVLLQHCIGVSRDEVKILADTGTHVGSSPGGESDIMTMMMLGVNVAITTDGPKFNGGADLFQAARAFQSAHRRMDNDGSYLPSEKVMEMITIDAARALGWDNEIGSLEAGKKADVITVNLLHPRLMPNFNLVHRLIGNAQGSDVDNVFVDGIQLMEYSVVCGVDERKILLEGHEEMERTIKRASLEKFAYPTEHFWGQYKQYYQNPRYDIEWQREDGGYY
jgi:cytosine/adenosine deaminase-related metal-dependent hydrolase